MIQKEWCGYLYKILEFIAISAYLVLYAAAGWFDES